MVKHTISLGEIFGTSTKVKTTETFSAENIRKRLKNNEYALALVLASTRLEFILGKAIREHYSWDYGEFEKQGYDEYSLGKYMEECTQYGVLTKHHNDLNQMRTGDPSFVNLRNQVAHNYGYLKEIENSVDTQQEVEGVVKDAIQLIEEVDISQK